MNTLPNRLKHYRKRKRLTQEATAAALGIRPQNYAKYESGDRTPKDDKLIALASLFDVTYNALYYGVERDFADLLHAHIKTAVLGRVESFYAYASDVMKNNEAFEVVDACFAKWDALIREQAPQFYSEYIIGEPDLRSLISLNGLCQKAEQAAYSHEEFPLPFEVTDGRRPLDAYAFCRLAFCIAVTRYLYGTGCPCEILAEADELNNSDALTPLQYFAVKVFVPYLAYISDTVTFVAANTFMGDFELAFLYDALSLPDDDEPVAAAVDDDDD